MQRRYMFDKHTGFKEISFNGNFWEYAFEGIPYKTSAITPLKPRGTFVAWMLSPKSAQDVAAWARMIGVPNIVPPDEMHATIMHSADAAVSPDEHGEHPLPMPVELGRYNLPRTEVLGKAGSKGALVTTYDAPRLTARHYFWRDQRGLVHGHEDFVPHVTVSYDASSIPADVYRRAMEHPCPIPVAFDRERVAHCNP